MNKLNQLKKNLDEFTEYLSGIPLAEYKRLIDTPFTELLNELGYNEEPVQIIEKLTDPDCQTC